MNAKGRLFIVASVLLVCAIGAAVLVKNAQSHDDDSKLAAVTLVGDCAISPARDGLDRSTNPELRKLAEYETVCGGSFSDSQMIFAPMPTSSHDVLSAAVTLSYDLKELNRQSVTPIVVFEPASSPGFLKDIQSSSYESILDTYYQKLKSVAITDQMMGTWVLFPEANTPAWSITNPATFSTNVTRVGQVQRKFFPQSKISILLNNQSYPDNDVNWNMGKYADLTPYVANIPKGLVSSFGYQGFPWAPPANETGIDSVTDAKAFLRMDAVTAAANALGIKDVWFNTGTFGRSNTESSDTLVTMAPAARSKILSQVLSQATALQTKGYTVSINIFAQDKSMNKERVDWSYWPQGMARDSASTGVLKAFLRTAQRDRIDLSVYDTDYQ